MEELKRLGILWGEIRKHRCLTVDRLRKILSEKAPELLDGLEDMLMRLHALYMIDYDGKNIKPSTILDPEIAEMPCIGCEKLKTCKPGSRNNPLRCEKFVRWFVKKFAEY